VLGAAAAVLASWVIVPRIMKRPAPAAAQAAGQSAPAAALPAAEPVDCTPLVRLQEYARTARASAAAAWPADPFYSMSMESKAANPATDTATAEPGAPAAKYTLSAIITGAAPRALINNQIVGVGERLADGNVVRSIEHVSVTLEGPSGITVVPLAQLR
jgi:hypothetical protein